MTGSASMPVLRRLSRPAHDERHQRDQQRPAREEVGVEEGDAEHAVVLAAEERQQRIVEEQEAQERQGDEALALAAVVHLGPDGTEAPPGVSTLAVVSSLEGSGQELTTPIGALVTRAPLVVRADATVVEAARAMRDAGASAALVGGPPLGIVTDRDLRNRVVAEGLGADTPVRAVTSRPLFALPAETPLFEALRRMLERRIHHLPITRAGEVVAVLGDTDLLRHQARSPLARRLLVLAERDLGPAPCAYAWMALGSEGRMEQVLLTDQDNALVYADDSAEARAYFPRLAARVVDGLVAAGFPPCPGGYMASQWCRSLADWQALFRGWIERPDPQALLE